MHKNGSVSTKRLCKNDLILIAVILLAGCLGLIWMNHHGSGGKQVKVTVDGEVYGVYSLEKPRKITIHEDSFTNIIRIQDGKVEMEKADCPDKICVNHSAIRRKGETIVCLPHKVVVEVIGESRGQEESSVDIISK